MASLSLGSGRRQSGSRLPTSRPKNTVPGDKTKVGNRYLLCASAQVVLFTHVKLSLSHLRATLPERSNWPKSEYFDVYTERGGFQMQT